MVEESQRYLRLEHEDSESYISYFTVNAIVGELDFPSSEIFYFQQQQFTFPVDTSMNVEIVGNKKALTTVRNKKKELKDLDNHAYQAGKMCIRDRYFGDGIRDNFNFRVGLGRMSELGYGMLFGSDVKKQFFQKRIKGRGYCDVGTSVISEFYTPLVPKGYDFLGTIGKLAHIRQDGQVACGAKATGTD